MRLCSPLHDAFDRVVFINLARRQDRLERFQQAIDSWPFRMPQRFEAVDGFAEPVPADWKHGPGAWGCARSHQAVLASALADNISTLMVLEDDAYPVPQFADRAADFLANVPQDWDCLMFGAEHLSPPITVCPGVVRCAWANRTHAFALRGKMMLILLAFWRRFKSDHCDVVLASLMPHFKVYAPAPFLIGQYEGHSDVTNSVEQFRFLTAEQIAGIEQEDERYVIGRAALRRAGLRRAA